MSSELKDQGLVNSDKKSTKRKSIKNVSNYKVDSNKDSEIKDIVKIKSIKKISFQEIPVVNYIKMSQQEIEDLIKDDSVVIEKIEDDVPVEKHKAEFILKRTNSQKNEFPKNHGSICLEDEKSD